MRDFSACDSQSWFLPELWGNAGAFLKYCVTGINPQFNDKVDREKWVHKMVPIMRTLQIGHDNFNGILQSLISVSKICVYFSPADK